MMKERNYATDNLRTGNRLKSSVRIGSQVNKKETGISGPSSWCYNAQELDSGENLKPE